MVEKGVFRPAGFPLAVFDHPAIYFFGKKLNDSWVPEKAPLSRINQNSLYFI
jgi:hypothetical protein